MTQASKQDPTQRDQAPATINAKYMPKLHIHHWLERVEADRAFKVAAATPPQAEPWSRLF